MRCITRSTIPDPAGWWPTRSWEFKATNCVVSVDSKSEDNQVTFTNSLLKSCLGIKNAGKGRYFANVLMGVAKCSCLSRIDQSLAGDLRCSTSSESCRL